MNQRSISQIIFAVAGIPILMMIGVWSATDPFLAGTAAGLMIGIVVVTQLGTKVWLLIPFFSAFGGSLNILPGHFAPRDLVAGLVAVILPALWVVRRFPIRIRIGNLEIALLVLLAFVGQAFVRNPVGLAIFGSSVIGGRPYFQICVSIVAFMALSVLVVDFRSIRMMVFAKFAGGILSAMYATTLGLFPILAYYSAGVYQGGGASGAISDYLSGGEEDIHSTGRRKYLKMFGRPLTILVLSFKSPLQLLNPRNFGFLLLIAVAGICVLVSGFRSEFAYLGLLVIAACFLHRKKMQLLFIGVIGGPILAVLLLLQGSVLELPLSAQRTLSFLPADWDQRAIDRAKGSSEWRFEMWEEALTSDRYIRNKWLGDGFGFTAHEMAYQQELMTQGTTPGDTQEYFLMTGTYHSGPVETIKRIGYLGLACLLVVLGVFFHESIALINKARGTPYPPYAIFVGLPMIINPVIFVFIYGSFQGILTGLLLGGGGLRLIRNSLEAWIQNRNQESATVIASGAAGRRLNPGAVELPASS